MSQVSCRIGTEKVDASEVDMRSESSMIHYSLTEASVRKFHEELELTRKIVHFVLGKGNHVKTSRVLPYLTDILNTLQRYMSLQKIPAIIEKLRKEIDNGHQVCVVSMFRDTTVHLQDALKRGEQVTLYPSTPKDRKQSALKRFKKGSVNVLIAQPHCLDHSVDLTHMNRIIFTDLSLTPSTNIQAILRCFNDKQTENVDVRIMTLRDQTDIWINNVVSGKMRDYFGDGILRV